MRSFLALSLVALSSCYDDGAYKAILAHQAAQANTTSSSGEGSGPVGITVTVTGVTSGESSSTTETSSGTEGGGEGEGEIEPQVFLQVSPPVLEVAGPVAFTVEHSSEIERLALFEGDSDEPTLEWLADEAPPPLLVTRRENSDVLAFTVRGYDAEDRSSVSDPAFVQLLLPPPGTLLWEKTFEVGNKGRGRSVASGLVKDEPKIIVGFDSNTKARAGRFTAEGDMELVAPASSAPVSTVSAVALDQAGNILAVGTDTIDDESRPWLALIDPHTADVNYLFKGKVGEVATGLALDAESGRIYVSGHSPGDKPSASDARIWVLSETGALFWTKTWERPVDELYKGLPVDVAYGIAVLENGDPVLVGESSYQPPGDKPPPPIENWAFALRYNSNGTLDADKTWTSEGALSSAGAHAVIPDRDNGLLVAGWSSIAEGAPRQATFFGFGEFLKAADLYTVEATHQHTAQGLARLPTGDMVLAMDVDNTDDGVYFAELRGVEGLFGPPPWHQDFGGDGIVGRVSQVTLTANAHILVVGTRVTAGINTMFLAALHP